MAPTRTDDAISNLQGRDDWRWTMAARSGATMTKGIMRRPNMSSRTKLRPMPGFHGVMPSGG